MEKTDRPAVLIDADNPQPVIVERLSAAVATYHAMATEAADLSYTSDLGREKGKQ